jgi:hypothetical protein
LERLGAARNRPRPFIALEDRRRADSSPLGRAQSAQTADYRPLLQSSEDVLICNA